ncbi:MAG: BamA/TamA family outer membrane protein, partial [Gammaproteobacteria bacterium]|nr:BamA/TamA family outer membrane protein [Gammaproteobacteria bacterium]
GFVQGQKLNMLLRRLIEPVQGIRDFDELPIPFRAVATDAESGNMIVLGRGDLVAAIKASMSAPGVFAPVEIDGRLLIDGGVANNLPIDVVRAMGADLSIVVDIGFPLLPRDKLNSALSLTNQMLTILIKRKSDQQLNTLTGRDIAILPDLGDIGSTDFHRSAEAAPLGELAAREQLDALQALGIGEIAYTRYQIARESLRDKQPRVVRNLTINDDSGWSSRVLKGSISVLPGTALDTATLQNDIARLYGLNSFSLVDYSIDTVSDEQADVTITTDEKSWGPNFINLGIKLQDDFEGSSRYDFGMRYTKTQVNPLGAEWRIDLQVGDNPLMLTEFYQPLNYASRYFIAPQIGLEKRVVNQFSPDGNVLSQFRLSSSRALLDVGRTFGQNSEVRLGVSRGTSRASLRIGDPSISGLEFETGALRMQYSYDSRDNTRFPRAGSAGGLRWDGFRQFMGDESNNDRLTLDWLSARSFGEHTWVVSANAGSNLNSDGQIEDLFDIGGLFNLSGYRNGQLRGQHSLVTGVAYYRRIGLGSSTFKTPLYVGLSGEAGNVWMTSDDISLSDLRFAGSVFVGLDTFIGPLYLAYGFAENGNSATYFLLGQPFSR